MKAILIALSALALTASGAFASQHGEGRFMQYGSETDLHASDLMGANVYVTQTDVAATTVDRVPDDWENVATIDDFVLSQDGRIVGVLVDVGGFLGIGARTTMVSMDALNIVRDHDSDDILVVFTSTREELEQAPEYDRDWHTRDAADRDARTDAERAEEERVAEEERRMLGVPEQRPEGFEPIGFADLTADELQNAAVYDRFNERVASISDVVLSSDGTEVQAVLIDVGGFLGLFTRTVSVDIDQLEIQSDPQRNDVRVYLNMTEEQLEALPEHQR